MTNNSDIYIKDEGHFNTMIFMTDKAKAYYNHHLIDKTTFKNVALKPDVIKCNVFKFHIRELMPKFEANGLVVNSEVDYDLPEFKLKNINYSPELSEETPAFTADIYQGGKCMAHVRNSGQGGSNSIIPAKGVTYNEVAVFDDMDVESAIFQLVETQITVKKHQVTAFVLVDANGQIFTQKYPNGLRITKLKSAPNYREWLSTQRKVLTNEGYSILNTNL